VAEAATAMTASKVVIPTLRGGVILSTLLGARLGSPHCENLLWKIPILSPGTGGVKSCGRGTPHRRTGQLTGTTGLDRSSRVTVARAATIV
jgi:hypothetical protein